MIPFDGEDWQQVALVRLRNENRTDEPNGEKAELGERGFVYAEVAIWDVVLNTRRVDHVQAVEGL